MDFEQNFHRISYWFGGGPWSGSLLPERHAYGILYCIVYEYLSKVILLSLWIIASFLDTIYDKGIGETIFQLKFAGLLLTWSQKYFYNAGQIENQKLENKIIEDQCASLQWVYRHYKLVQLFNSGSELMEAYLFLNCLILKTVF